MKTKIMNEEKATDCCSSKMIFSRGRHHNHCHCSSSPNAIYGLGVVGALFYFLQGASGFVAIITAIGKAIFWPAILMFHLLTFFQL